MNGERNHPEILAPVGGKEQLIAAVRSGADAVYLGAKGFNARRNAENFPELGEVVSYCHGRGVKVYVTVNTLVTDDEFGELRKTLDEVAKAGADAVILQDLAVAKLLREEYPTIPMHASTQMAVHNADGLKVLEKLGFRRAVVARETSLAEIRILAKSTRMELESFVHGAHCMSLSGGCYLSSMIGGRSGNRGLCAQPCRLDFSCKGRAYALSLRDMCYLDHVKELSEAGICSFKIEGRMKRPEYVAGAVTAYREEAERVEMNPEHPGNEKKREDLPVRNGKKNPKLTEKNPVNAKKNDEKAGQGAGKSVRVNKEVLRAVFSRSGFTDGYLTGKRDVGMFGTRTKEDVTAAAGVLGELASLYRLERESIPVDMTFTAGLGMESVLTATDGENWVSVSGQEAEAARTMPMTKMSLRKALEKTGGTPFVLRELDAQFTGGGAAGILVPPSELNRMRREALEALLTQRSETAPHKKNEEAAERNRKEEYPNIRPYVSALYCKNEEMPRDDESREAKEKEPFSARDGGEGLITGDSYAHENRGESSLPDAEERKTESERADNGKKRSDRGIAPEYRLRFETYEQYKALSGEGTAILPVRVLIAHPELVSGRRIIAELPSVHFPSDDAKLEQSLRVLKEAGLTDILTEDLGGLWLGKRLGFFVHGGFGLNILNTAALSEYERLGLSDATVSFELRMSRISALGGTLPRGIVVYGYLPLMKLRSCPARTKDGCRGCSGKTEMTDRKGERFTVFCRERKYSELLNCVPLYIADKTTAPVDFITLYFTTEAPEMLKEILSSYRTGLAPEFRRTNGLYYRELL